MIDLVDLEPAGDGRWRAVGLSYVDGKSVDALEVTLQARTWQEAVSHLHYLHPDVPAHGWSQVAGARWQWSHTRHRARPGSPQNPHRLVITMAGPAPHAVHTPPPAAPRRRWWPLALALLVGLLVGAAVVGTAAVLLRG